MLESSPVFIVGRFPPPLDGQSVATERLGQLLDGQYRVIRLNTEPNDGVQASDTKLRPSRVVHYSRLRARLKRALKRHPSAPVIWTSISPTPIGHYRDLLTTLPAVGPDHPLIAVSHRANLDELFGFQFVGRTAALIERRVTRFVFLTEAISERCSPWIPPDKRSIIPNTVDEEVLCTDSEVEAREPVGRPISVLFLSNMLPEKGYMDVLEALGLLDIEVHARFVGAWPSQSARRDFESRIDQLGLGDAIEVLGPIHDRTRVKHLMLGSDTLVLPTFHPTEGLPITILESINAGTPVIATRAGGIPEVLSDGLSGLFVSPHAPEEIAAAIQKLSDRTTWLRLSRGARQRFKTAFHPTVIGGLWSALLAESLR